MEYEYREASSDRGNGTRADGNEAEVETKNDSGCFAE